MDRKATFAALALTAASLFVAASAPAAESGSNVLRAKCFGANACKGHGQCASNNNACKGLNACRGQGFETLPLQACRDRQGRA